MLKLVLLAVISLKVITSCHEGNPQGHALHHSMLLKKK